MISGMRTTFATGFHLILIRFVQFQCDKYGCEAGASGRHGDIVPFTTSADDLVAAACLVLFGYKNPIGNA